MQEEMDQKNIRKVKNSTENQEENQEQIFQGWHITIMNPSPEEERTLKHQGNLSYLEYFVRPDYNDTQIPVLEAYIVYLKPRTRPDFEICEPVKFVKDGFNIFERCQFYLRGLYMLGKKPRQELKYDIEDCINKLKKGVMLSVLKKENPHAWNKYPAELTQLRRRKHTARTYKPCVIWLWGQGHIKTVEHLLRNNISSHTYLRNSANWDDYDQHPVVILRYFSDYSANELSNLLAYWEFSVQVADEKVQFNSPTVYIVSEFLPSSYFNEKQFQELKLRISLIMSCSLYLDSSSSEVFELTKPRVEHAHWHEKVFG